MKSKIIYTIVFVLAFSFQSCYRAMKYPLPSLEPDELFREFDASDTITIADIPWREFFTDQLLISLIEEGLENNTDLRIAFARITAAEANLQMARQAFFPEVTLAGQVNEVLGSNGTDGKKVLGYSSPQYSLGITATWEADLWGKLLFQSRARESNYLASVEYARLVTSSLVANIASSYYTLMALDKQLDITIRTAGVVAESTETIQALMEAGMLTGAAVQQSMALYYSTLVTIPDIEYGIYQTENSLSALLARDPGPIERNVIDSQVLPPYFSYGIPAQMLSRRPDVLQAELALRAAFELTESARAAFYPSVSLGTGTMIGYGSTRLSDFFRPENLLANIIGQVAQPLYARGQLRGNLKIAKASQFEALMTFRQTVLDAGEEVSNIVFAYSSSVGKNPIRENQIKALSTAVYFTKELLNAGEANYTEVLTAEQNLLSAELSRVNDKLEQLQYSVNLYRALGGGTDDTQTLYREYVTDNERFYSRKKQP